MLVNLLDRPSVHDCEGGPPCFMTAKNFVEATFESFPVQRSGIVNRDGLVIQGKVRRKLSMNPYLLLSMGKRNGFAGFTARNCGDLVTRSKFTPEIFL